MYATSCTIFSAWCNTLTMYDGNMGWSHILCKTLFGYIQQQPSNLHMQPLLSQQTHIHISNTACSLNLNVNSVHPYSFWYWLYPKVCGRTSHLILHKYIQPINKCRPPGKKNSNTQISTGANYKNPPSAKKESSKHNEGRHKEAPSSVSGNNSEGSSTSTDQSDFSSTM